MLKETGKDLENLQQCGVWLGEHLKTGRQLLLDGDGVLVKGDSLNKTIILDPELLPVLTVLEENGVKIGMATERGEHIVQWLREHSLKLEGVSIIEGGQAVIDNGRLKYLVPENFLQFVGELRRKLMDQPGWKKSWGETEQLPTDSFCSGNHQWQGRARASFWFRQTGSYGGDLNRLKSLFLRPIMSLAAKDNLEIGADIGLSLVRMKTNDLGILVVKHNQVEKATAAGCLTNGAVLVEDGFGAINLGRAIKERGGGVIGLKGNLDISADPDIFLREVADFVLEKPAGLVQVLTIAKSNLK